jgi:regulator of protease activity HflC (stomatin/prohibitin superfamily)
MSCCFATVSTGEVAIVQRMGKFSRLAEAGCLCLCYPFEDIAGKVSLRVQELKVKLETKTLDNVFVSVSVSVQYQAVREKVYSAFYSLQDVEQQMRSYIFDVVRSSLCLMKLDHAFESKEEISGAVKHHLQDVFNGYGKNSLKAQL